MNSSPKKNSFIKNYPVTSILAFSNFIIYVIQEITGDSNNAIDLVNMGARYDLSLIHI